MLADPPRLEPVDVRRSHDPDVRRCPNLRHGGNRWTAAGLESTVCIVDAGDDIGIAARSAVAENFDRDDVGRGGDTVGGTHSGGYVFEGKLIC